MSYHIKENYYFDLDLLNQFRLTGPENHLLLGMSFPADVVVKIVEYELIEDQLEIKLELNTDRLEMPLPLVTDIRTLRSFTEVVKPRPSYAQLSEQGREELLPKSIRHLTKSKQTILEFSNTFKDESGSIKQYGAQLIFPNTCSTTVKNRRMLIECARPLRFTIRALTNIKVSNSLGKRIFLNDHIAASEKISLATQKLADVSQLHTEHLIRSNKTSSFEYGTIFPRDWIESADLGQGDLTPETIDYMYEKSLGYVSEEGEGWHEEVVGEYRTKFTNESELIDRKMIDIEPRYILGLRRVSKRFLTKEENQIKLKAVAKYVLRQAQENELLSFKRIAGSEDEYYVVGNWRDSVYGFPNHKPPLSPYDVNCVFYPLALEVILDYADFFDIDNTRELKALIARWHQQKDKFRLYHGSEIIGYSLALHGKKHKPLPIAQLDESYDLFYGEPSLEEIVSFAKKLLDENYFYTPAGPLLVAADEEDFTTEQYHGKVIWPKQAAYAVAGLGRQFRRGLKESWPWPVMEIIRDALLRTAEACFHGWEELNAVPELYYYDAQEKRARFYTDQPQYEGQMSMIQLWSSVGCRRIIREYRDIQKTQPYG